MVFVDWPSLLRQLWLCSAVYAGLLLLAVVWDKLFESFQCLRYSFCQKCNTRLLALNSKYHPARSPLARGNEIIQMIGGIVMFLIFCIRVQRDGTDTDIDIVEAVFVGYFALKFGHRLLMSPMGYKWGEIWSLTGFVNAFTIVSSVALYANFIDTAYTFGFLRIIRVFLSYDLLEGSWLANSRSVGELCRHIARMVVLFIALISTFAACVVTVSTALT